MTAIEAWFVSVNPLWWIAALVFVIGCYTERRLDLLAKQNRQIYDALMRVDGVEDAVLRDVQTDREINS